MGRTTFQAQGRYFEDSIQFCHLQPVVPALRVWSASSSIPRPWPTARYRWCTRAACSRTACRSTCRSATSCPTARNIADLFPPTRDALTVMLAIPPRKPEGLNCAAGPAGRPRDARYVAEPRVFHDENTGARRALPCAWAARTPACWSIPKWPATWWRCRSPASCGTAPGTSSSTRTSSRPCIQISASERLMLMLRRLIEILEEKAAIARAASGEAGRSIPRAISPASGCCTRSIRRWRRCAISGSPSAATRRNCSSKCRAWAGRCAPSRSNRTRAPCRSTTTTA